jgi:general L-amino acid transport system substrate-binding protein
MRFSSLKTLAVVAAAFGTLASLPAHAGKTLDGIKARGQVICGANTGLAGFSAADSAGKWTGLDVDVFAVPSLQPPWAMPKK